MGFVVQYHWHNTQNTEGCIDVKLDSCSKKLTDRLFSRPTKLIPLALFKSSKVKLILTYENIHLTHLILNKKHFNA